MRAWTLLPIALVTLAAGCGGGGANDNGSTANSTVPEDYMASLKAAILTRDRDTISNRIDLDYLDSCESHDDLVNSIMAALATGPTVTFDILPITGKVVNETRGEARFNGGFHLDVASGDAHSALDISGTIHLQANVGIWRLYGNQECSH